ncbi:hypothetical protein GALMADRAFT_145798 [Galerina marginata CBS 339.88]|uniref:Uncharacterized protein n=1 Tax=Galerina marginata (strain CBS 339.88) TaxID=685588 RepID=A0A067SDR6_GALM3|nr:hypothetical protein GALMADRAFT_145798 [Galerina marginata CBS 339.88]
MSVRKITIIHPSVDSLSQPTRETIFLTLVNAAKSPILKLPNDILWRVFWINADLEGDMPEDEEDDDVIPALETLRHSSQVCERWRRLILSSSSLWGQVINITCLESDEWREEVLRRTGQSLLCVLGGNRHDGLSGYQEIAVDLVYSYWDRIRWLELNFADSRCQDGRLWKTFERSSDVLEIFRVTLFSYEQANETYTPILSDPDFVIFSNHAPALRTFYAPNIRFNYDAPWLAHLHYLALSAAASAGDVLGMLTHMPQLECLVDEDSNAIHRTGASLSHIMAPALSQILILSWFDMRPYVDFLLHVTPAARCSLGFTYNGAIPDAETLSSAKRVLSIYSRRCDLASASEISLTLLRYQFEFEAQVHSTGPFSFDLDFRGEGPGPFETTETLFFELPQHSYDKVCRLQSLRPLFNLPTRDLPTSSYRFPGDILASFLPQLQKIGLASFPTAEEISTVKTFLTSRLSIGKPVLTLAVATYAYDRADLIIRSLDEFTGLKIIFEQIGSEDREYICGSGHTDDLPVGVETVI